MVQSQACCQLHYGAIERAHALAEFMGKRRSGQLPDVSHLSAKTGRGHSMERRKGQPKAGRRRTGRAVYRISSWTFRRAGAAARRDGANWNLTNNGFPVSFAPSSILRKSAEHEMLAHTPARHELSIVRSPTDPHVIGGGVAVEGEERWADLDERPRIPTSSIYSSRRTSGARTATGTIISS